MIIYENKTDNIKEIKLKRISIQIIPTVERIFIQSS